jgi:hypothetical protein
LNGAWRVFHVSRNEPRSTGRRRTLRVNLQTGTLRVAKATRPHAPRCLRLWRQPLRSPASSPMCGT